LFSAKYIKGRYIMILSGGLTFSGGLTVTPQPPPSSKAIFGYGTLAGDAAGVSMTNLVSNTGVVATDTTGVGTVRWNLAAAGYGTDKAIFGFGQQNYPDPGGTTSKTNLVSNTGVVATDTTNASTNSNSSMAAAGYGTDKAVFYGGAYDRPALVTNTGVLGTMGTSVGTQRFSLAAAGYDTDKAIFGYGTNNTIVLSMTNLVSNTGTVAADTTGVGTARQYIAAAGYGTDKALFGYGSTSMSWIPTSITNLVSNTGVVATDTAGVGTVRATLAAASYGVDTAIFGYGQGASPTYSKLSMTNLVSNTGVVASDTTGVGTARLQLAAASYGAA
jgi:hypothetical protein